MTELTDEQSAVAFSEGDACKPSVRLATSQDREKIYRLRHEVFAAELHQHHTNASGRLTDPLDEYNEYIVISQGAELLGSISITPPGRQYSLDKYLPRHELPFPFDSGLYEIRLMAVPQPHRRTLLSLALMYASFRWAEAHGGRRLIAIGRGEIRSMHLRVGLKPIGINVQAGEVTYGVLQATMQDIHDALPGVRSVLDRIEAEMSWDIGVPFDTPASCYHGGQFFEAVGEEFETLERLDEVISADVLDAWFPPAPGALEALQRHLPRLLQTSPPTACEGLVRAIARARGVPPESILPGGGSSDLIFLALRHWLTSRSRVLLLKPTYGEYIHVLEKLVRCQVSYLPLRREENYRVDPSILAERLKERFELVVLVNPNSPTGQHTPRTELESIFSEAPPETRIWLDETYLDYVGAEQSLEQYAARSRNVIVCKSMSKTYALSGARVAYLCASPHQLEALRPISPPWAVSLPAQVAAVKALADPAYYIAKYRETHVLREQLAQELRRLGWDVLPSAANFLLCYLPDDGPDAGTLILRCRELGLFLRDTSTMGLERAERCIRIAVKDAETNSRMLAILQEVLGYR
jgi:histidinol-phosphate/aromatic aminotransferase/cobyric acid decarboxylase-like protein